MPDTLHHVTDHSLSTLARGLVGSEVLKIASEVRALMTSGRSVANLTVGDFAPSEFRIPRLLESLIAEALAAGQTNYPPSDGTIELRKSVVDLMRDEFGLTYPLESILIAGGSRPVIYAAYSAVVDRGDRVIYSTPSWNNNHYTYLAGGVPVELVVGADTNFMPTAEMIRPHVRDARLIAVCTPLNPTGTVMAKGEVEAIATLVVEENERRADTGERPLFLLWDQVYWMLTFGRENRHWTPPQLVPESAAYTIFVDGISKAFAATGLRVGWTVAPPAVTARMRDLIGHVGAWAPKPEQLAVATFLRQKDEIAAFHAQMIRELRSRLDALYDGFMAMRNDGLPVHAITPQGAIYLSAQFDLVPRFGTNEAIRKFLLEEAGFAVVPFQAFGLKREDGWFRLSAGAVSLRDIEDGLARVRAALVGLSRA
ncbi:MAG TPA: aminotransferase class I/II-fold pyridoxal phosphate-dependent enzyme [Thermoanaerobaculia bacterium]|jgi:aspartate aminotransferase|nr:aminotransferase class I/II-fold pyridoxal phosphate-dependent enzyme [Thermoanaerobaculia bacterium]